VAHCFMVSKGVKSFGGSGYQLTFSTTVALDLRPVLGLGAVASSMSSCGQICQNIVSKVEKVFCQTMRRYLLFSQLRQTMRSGLGG
jgi:hypothetical protein